MPRLLVLVYVSFLFAVVFSCSPTKTAPRPVASTPTTTSTDKARRKRSVEDEVKIIVVTKKNIDESTKDLHFDQVKNIFEDHKERTGATMNLEIVEKKLVNHGGKIAVEYKMNNDCNEVKEVTKRIKAESHIIVYSLVKCKDQPLELF